MNAAQRKATTLVQGYVIQSWKIGASSWEHEDVKAYSPKGQLPQAWEATKENPEIAEARIYRTTQVVKRADKRILNDSFKREA